MFTTRYRWRVPASVQVYREIPATRSLMTSAGGYFPIIVPLGDGGVAAVLREGDAGVGQRGWYGFVRSDDGGISWSESTRIVLGPRDPAHLSFGRTSNGRLIVSFVFPHAYADGRWDRGTMPGGPIFQMHSDDDGQSWSAPFAIDTSSIPAPIQSPYGRILQLPDGCLLLNVYVNWPTSDAEMRWNDPESRIYGSYILRSSDNGATWGNASLISRENHNEAALVRHPSGTLLAAMRRFDPRAGDDIWVAESHDDGFTWSAATKVTQHHEHPADLVCLADGRVLLVYGRRTPPFGVRALVSRDGGASWDAGSTITLSSESITRNGGYPSAVALDDGHLLVSYYVGRSPGPFVHRRDELAGPYAAAVRVPIANLP